MKTLADYTCPMLLAPGLHGQNPSAVIHELSYLLYRAGFVPDVLPFYRTALERERIGSSATDYGWAWPRAMVQDLAQPCFALGRCLVPLAWSPGLKPSVRCVFLLAVPMNYTDNDRALEAGLRRLNTDQPLRRRLCAARDLGEMFDVLSQINLPALVDDAA
ncbi:MAG TPA: PTS sugar transporter subunit IIA [Opitutaceae bacterium]|nr:PTS sugar transporter subunit IIA [Opitutaceae bacterium]